MTLSILIAGFGGQGVLSMGKLIAYAAAIEGKEVTWLPSYGPEQRGGTSNVTVVVSTQRISSPIRDTFDIVVALNQQSLTKFESKVCQGGSLFFDPEQISVYPERTDISVRKINVLRIAKSNGLVNMQNMIMLGSLLDMTHIAEPQTVLNCLRKTLPQRHWDKIPDNERAMQLGHEARQDAA